LLFVILLLPLVTKFSLVDDGTVLQPEVGIPWCH